MKQDYATHAVFYTHIKSITYKSATMRMKRINSKYLLILLVLLILFTNSESPSITMAKSRGSSQTPDYWPTDGWRTSTPEDQGVSSVKLQEIYEYLNSTWELGILQVAMRSLLIIRNSYLIHENYFSSFGNENSSGNIFSCTKSITSTLIGIAIEEGHIGSVNDPILNYFPNRTIQNIDSWKESMTIEDLLTMRSGFTWDESNYDDPLNDYSQMYGSPNAVQYVLDRPMVSIPGRSWVYNTGNSHLLSAIVDNTTGIGTKEFAQTRLFDPLGIEHPDWTLDNQRIPYGGSNLRITARELAKFGYLFLFEGQWDGQQIVSKEWVAAATQASDTTSYYGYQWWVEPSRNAYSARGYKGQYLLVIPEYDMLIVFTGDSVMLWELYQTLIDQYIIPAIGYVPPTTTTTTTGSLNTSLYVIPIILALGIFVVHRKKRFLER
ncbi:MAG: serine hydrolase domain-containing protein [Candidatus Heimdallarchaeota archaeon]